MEYSNKKEITFFHLSPHSSWQPPPPIKRNKKKTKRRLHQSESRLWNSIIFPSLSVSPSLPQIWFIFSFVSLPLQILDQIWNLQTCKRSVPTLSLSPQFRTHPIPDVEEPPMAAAFQSGIGGDEINRGVLWATMLAMAQCLLSPFV